MFFDSMKIRRIIFSEVTVETVQLIDIFSLLYKSERFSGNHVSLSYIGLFKSNSETPSILNLPVNQ